MKKSLVITSINKLNYVIEKYIQLCNDNNINFIFVSDKKTPSFKDDNILNIDIDMQNNIFEKLSNLVYFNHYARKNFGYLYSFNDSEIDLIYETDDDNYPSWEFFDDINLNNKIVTGKRFINIYEKFSNEKIWPRGLPLDEIFSFGDILFIENTNALLEQRLVNNNPDVDAVYRLTNKDIEIFFKQDRYFINKYCWCPFNSQNTIWRRDIFELMYLPSTCSFRMTDIYRSFIAQRILWENNNMVLFSGPSAVQYRNEHNIIKDFIEEYDGYINIKNICSILENVQLKSGFKNNIDNIYNCYDKLIINKIIDKKEIEILNEWCNCCNINH